MNFSIKMYIRKYKIEEDVKYIFYGFSDYKINKLKFALLDVLKNKDDNEYKNLIWKTKNKNYYFKELSENHIFNIIRKFPDLVVVDEISDGIPPYLYTKNKTSSFNYNEAMRDIITENQFEIY